MDISKVKVEDKKQKALEELIRQETDESEI